MAWRIEQLDKRIHDRESFTCGKPELDGYLKQIARKAAEIDTGRTWVATDPATPADATGKQAIAGYYTVSMSSIDVSVIPAARRILPAPVPTALMSSTRSMVTQIRYTSVTDPWSLPTIRCTSSDLWPRRLRPRRPTDGTNTAPGSAQLLRRRERLQRKCAEAFGIPGAGNEIRSRDPRLGKAKKVQEVTRGCVYLLAAGCKWRHTTASATTPRPQTAPLSRATHATGSASSSRGAPCRAQAEQVGFPGPRRGVIRCQDAGTLTGWHHFDFLQGQVCDQVSPQRAPHHLRASALDVLRGT